MKKNNWKKYAFEFLSIFIAVISAFALSNWNDNRQNRLSEEKILREIKNGIELDLKDFSGNKFGHRSSLRANQLFRDLISNKNINQDSIDFKYVLLFRDYTPIVNLSGYESLKASGLKTIENDSLRFEIITLYDFYYDIIVKLEDEIQELKSYTNYYHRINDLLYPYMVFNDGGQLIKFQKPIRISERNKKEIMSYLWRLEVNRKYKMGRYNLIQTKMKKLKTNIEKELKN